MRLTLIFILGLFSLSLRELRGEDDPFFKSLTLETPTGRQIILKSQNQGKSWKFETATR